MASTDGAGSQSSTEREHRVDRRAVLRGTFTVSVVGALAGCQSIFGGAKPDEGPTDEEEETDEPEATEIYFDDWEDGDSDGWEAFVAGGDGSSQVQQLSSPYIGNNALSLSQSQGGGTEYILATEEDFDIWGEAWTLRTAIHTTDLDPSENYQKYEIIPGYDEANEDDPSVAFGFGVRDDDYNTIPAQFTGEAVESDTTYEIDWAEDVWYNVEIAHDGAGGYTGTVWGESETQPTSHNVEATADVSHDDAQPLALHINGPNAPEFRMSHAFIELTTPP
jgi:hypothetical protein